jgi:hypothetical protein
VGADWGIITATTRVESTVLPKPILINLPSMAYIPLFCFLFSVFWFLYFS